MGSSNRTLPSTLLNRPRRPVPPPPSAASSSADVVESAVAGTVAEIKVEAGQAVGAGDIAVVITPNAPAE